MTGEPKQIRAGDTVTWDAIAESDYRASGGWALTYYLRGPSSLDVTGTANGDDWTVTITAAQSATLTPGHYSLVARVSKAAEVYTVSEVTLEVIDNPATQVAGYEARSHARVVLEAIEATIEGKATNAHQSVSIGGKAVAYMSMEELIMAKLKYERFVENEEAAEQVKKGLKSGKSVAVRFVNP